MATELKKTGVASIYNIIDKKELEVEISAEIVKLGGLLGFHVLIGNDIVRTIGYGVGTTIKETQDNVFDTLKKWFMGGQGVYQISGLTGIMKEVGNLLGELMSQFNTV